MTKTLLAGLFLMMASVACASNSGVPPMGRTDGPGGPIAFVASELKPPPTEIVSDMPVRPDPSDIYTVGADGQGLRRITSDGDPKGPLAWSPDGQTLAYTASPIGTKSAQLWLTDPTGEHAHLVCDGCDGALKYSGPNTEYVAAFDWLPRQIAWSPSGEWIAVTAGGGGLALIQPSSGEVKKFPSHNVLGLSWASDGSEIAYTVQDEGVFVADVASGELRLIATTERKIVDAVAWSPDGSTIAYSTTKTGNNAIRQGVASVDPSGNHVHVLLDASASFGIYDLEWSPDGSRLAAMFHPIEPPTAGLLTMGADGSDRRNVAICENGVDPDGLCPTNGAQVAWSPDGAHLMFDNYPGRGHQLTVLATDGSAVPVSGGLVPGCCFAWQPE